MHMSKWKKAIIVIVSCLVVFSGIYYGLHRIKENNKNSKTVSVYPVSDVGYDASMMWDSSTLSGSVNVNSEQRIYVGSTQKVAEIKVSEGQSVKAGDVLLVYDTTANDLQLQLRRSELELSRVAILDAKRDLEKLKQTVPLEDIPTTQAPTTQAPTTQAPTTEAPTTEATTTQESTTQESTTEAQGSDQTTEGSLTEASTTESTTTEAPTTQAPTTEAPTTEASADEDEEFEETPPTRDELKKMITAKEQEIRSMETQYEISMVSLQIEELQNETGEVLANFDGTIKSVSTENQAAANGEPLIVLSAADGYIVESQIGELALGSVHIGDTVSMYCYDTGMNYEGTITEISSLPAENSNNYSSKVETYYPMKIALADTGDIRQNMYMEITLNTSSEETSKGFYLSKAFIKQEATNYYVMKQVDGKLQKTYIKVGNKQSGDSVLVTGGLFMNDYIAFPYIDEAVEGTKTVEKSVDELYGDY